MLTRPSDRLASMAALCLLTVASATSGQCIYQITDGDDEHRYLGQSLAMDAGVAIVGWDDNNQDGATIYRQIDGVWVYEQALPVPAGLGSFLARSMAIEGDLAVIGAPFADVDRIDNAGAVIVYRYDGDTWIHDATITDPTPTTGGEFGDFICLSGNVLAVGQDGPVAESDVHVFRRDGEGTWQLEAVLTPDVESDSFGRSMDLDGDTLVVGDQFLHDDEVFVGAMHAYRYDEDAAAWVSEGILRSAAASQSHRFGAQVAVDGDRVVGTPHDGAYFSVFMRQRDGTWIEEVTIDYPANSSADQLAYADGILLIGDADEGIVRAFEDDGWTQVGSVESPADFGQDFARSLAFDGRTALVGEPDYEAPGVAGVAHGRVHAVAGFELVDCDGNGRTDGCDISLCTALDSNDDGLIDACVDSGLHAFTGAVSDTWTDAANWSGGRLPSAGADVIVAADAFVDDDALVGTIRVVCDAVLRIASPTFAATEMIVQDAGEVWLEQATLICPHVTVEHAAYLRGGGVINGDVEVAGTIAPGDEEPTLTVTGDLTLFDQATTHLDIRGPSPTLVPDRIDIAGQITMAGQLIVEFEPHVMMVGDDLTMLTWTSRAGEFASHAIKHLPDAMEVTRVSEATSLRLVVGTPAMIEQCHIASFDLQSTSADLDGDLAVIERTIYRRSDAGVWQVDHVLDLPSTSRTTLDGDRLVVTATVNGRRRVFIYETSGPGVWSLTAEIKRAITVPHDGYAWGWNHAISGDLLAISTWWPFEEGRVYVYRLIDGMWVEQVELTSLFAETPTPRMGNEVVLADGVVMVGTVGDVDPGGIYVFESDEDGVWRYTQSLHPDVDGAVGDIYFAGHSIDLDGDLMIASAGGIIQNRIHSMAFIYRRIGGVWRFEAQLSVPIWTNLFWFYDRIVSIEGATAVLSTHASESTFGTGQVNVYRHNGVMWSLQSVVTSPDPDPSSSDGFGYFTVMEGDTLMVLEALGNPGNGDTVWFYEGVQSDDCNENGVSDTCDILDNVSDDANDNGIPDECEGSAKDLNHDGRVDSGDVITLLATWGRIEAREGPGSETASDLNRDGVVNAQDLLVLMESWSE